MILKLQANVQRKIWGGKKLDQMKGLAPDDKADPVGETWEISTHKDGASLFAGNILQDSDLSMPLKYLVKFIDTGADLSIQVHPNDEYAKLHESSLGKTECWVILAAEKGAGIYLGLKADITKEAFESGINAGERMNEYLNFYEVKRGDFFFVPAGSIHAIGKGITLAEVQQSSGITYRVWDWNRVDSSGKPRELHVQKSLDVINFLPECNELPFFKYQSELLESVGVKKVAKHADFDLSIINLKENIALKLELDHRRISSILNLEHEIVVNGVVLGPFSSILFDRELDIEILSKKATSLLLIE